ncbi:hypothetical protein H0H81_003260 [Sphagnurus paluster]|uniref:F-box domain-containing protein n=1 Tax=Sphagnurus paluster TaxID=117069 RepID=A0A9P7GMR3_9AGAR|nr:hypothetical protein H0H81_003260 [Sphagnurus paluster]
MRQASRVQGGDQQYVIYDSRAAVYEKLGMPKKALRDAKAVITLAPNQWQGYARSARLFLLARKFDASLKMATIAMDRVQPAHNSRRIEIARLRDEILAAQEADERLKRATQNQSEKLPLELLSEIFHLVILSNPSRLIGLIHVCPYWRNVAWHTPSLWQTLVLTTKSPARKLSLWLKRSKGYIRELYLRAGVVSHIDWPFPDLKTLAWDKLRVCSAISWDMAAYLESQGIIPHALEALEMEEAQWARLRAGASLFPLLQTVGVRSLSFIRSYVSWKDLSTHLTTLTSIKIVGCSQQPDSLLSTLQANPFLETLIVQDNFTVQFPAEAPLVHLPHLRTLDFAGSWSSGLLEHITAPAVEVFRVKGSRCSLDTALTLLVSAQSLTNLTHFAVDNCPFTPWALNRVLMHTPSLKSLELVSLAKGANAVIEALAGGPLSPKGTTAPPVAPASTPNIPLLCPALTDIKVSHSADVRTGPLVRLIRARLPQPPIVIDPTKPDSGSTDQTSASEDGKNCARILSLTIDGCEQIDAAWLTWFRKQVPSVSFVFISKKKAPWKHR